jgi:hypothetical protein
MKKSTPLGALIDQLYAKDQAIDEVQALLRKENAARAKLEARLLKKMKAQKVTSSKGSRALAFIKTTPHPRISHAGKFWKFVLKNKAFDLVQNRIASRAYTARIESGIEVPGTEVFTSVRVNVTKAK